MESNFISDIKVSDDIISQYENIIKNLESKQRFLTKINFQQKLQIDAMKNKIEEYMEIKVEFEETLIQIIILVIIIKMKLKVVGEVE